MGYLDGATAFFNARSSTDMSAFRSDSRNRSSASRVFGLTGFLAATARRFLGGTPEG